MINEKQEHQLVNSKDQQVMIAESNTSKHVENENEKNSFSSSNLVLEKTNSNNRVSSSSSSAVVCNPEENQTIITPQILQAIPAESQSYWQSKLPNYLDEMMMLLSTGIDKESAEIIVETQPDSIELRLKDMQLMQKNSEGNTLDEQNIEQTRQEALRKLIKDSCIWVIEGKSGQQFDLIRLSSLLKSTSISSFSIEPQLASELTEKDIDFYRDIIVECAEKKSYDINLTKDILNLLKARQGETNNMIIEIGLHEIWEVKEIQSLSQNTRIEELDLLRKKRRFHAQLLKALDRLIKAIDKCKGEDEAFGAYSKIKANPPKIKQISQKLPSKKQSNYAVVVVDACQDEMSNQIEETLKRIKVDNDTTDDTPKKQIQQGITSPDVNQQLSKMKSQKKQISQNTTGKKHRSKENREEMNSRQNMKSEIEENSNSIQLLSSISSAEGSKQLQLSNKKSMTEVQNQVAKDINQKTLFNFFKKSNNNNNNNQFIDSSDSNQVNVQQQLSSDDNFVGGNVNEKKSIFRNIGSADLKPAASQKSNLNFLADITSPIEVLNAVKQASKAQRKMQTEQRLINQQKYYCNKQINFEPPQEGVQNNNKNNNNCLNRRRRILITIHDYVRQFKNVIFESSSSLISGRNFLKRDEVQVQYDLDSEDELQEMNAENIENEEDEEEEDYPDHDDDSGNKFIVSDGYLSDEGFDSDKEEFGKSGKQNLFNQKKLNFQDFNFTENPSKTGFIYQQSDNSLEVQNFLIGYRIQRFVDTVNSEPFPLAIKKQEQEQSAIASQVIINVWTQEKLKAIIRSIHGSYQSKKQLLEQMAKIEALKDVSKSKLEKKFKEISQKDEKIENETMKRWVVHSALIESIEFDGSEIEDLLKQRQDEYRNSRPKKEEKSNATEQAIEPQVVTIPQKPPVVPVGPVVGFNIFSSASPLIKNLNITPVFSLLKNQGNDLTNDGDGQGKQNNKQVVLPTFGVVDDIFETPIVAIQPSRPILRIIHPVKNIITSSIDSSIRVNEKIEEKNNSNSLQQQVLNENSNSSTGRRAAMKQSTLSFGVLTKKIE